MMDKEYIEGFGYISKKRLLELDEILQKQCEEIKKEIWGRPATEYTHKKAQALFDSLYGPDIFQINWGGGNCTEIWGYLKDRPKLIRIMAKKYGIEGETI